ncbi:hypothetical protein AC478_01705 [miscellaneous Crenarchaeota group-1 archaeon SG8-32-3]|uniref:Uncharacterized protein n=1 Tax=miscellaneous Crenarchaeota group-1 archaeon SG8-32-3 TaxID=1685125 RepID=A0A0M0BUF3_9ARCH|nr:MAG: hypothetical protein AC478_01705 [miscellaneous Crenarchaeota group-1 archaeon SG8-32-3]
MKGVARHQIEDLVVTSEVTIDPKTKCVTVAIYENDGKTIMQPLIGEQEAKPILELLENQTLEVWLSNGKTEISQFDVAILKYKQVLQSLTKCTQAKTKVCLKNFYESLVSCEQCPLNVNTCES